MRKLVLQMQMTVDGYVAGPNGELDWMTWNWDKQLKEFVNKLHESCDTILLGRKMTEGFTQHWESVVNNPPKESDDKALKENFEFAKTMVNLPKIVFSKSQKTISGKNVSITNNNLKDELEKLKTKSGKDIIVYGGAGFVSSLIAGGHIDELNLFINPVMINKGMRIFDALNKRQKLKLTKAKPYDCGITVLTYELDNN